MSDEANKLTDNQIPDDLPQDSSISYRKPQPEIDGNINDTMEMTSKWKLFINKSGMLNPQQVDPNDTQTYQPNKEKSEPDSYFISSTPSESGYNYLLHKIIGRGGNGEIWEATQISLQRQIAIKRLRKDIQGDSKDPLKDKFMMLAFQQEAFITGNLQHPNIIPVYDFGRDEYGNPMLAIKYIKGKRWADVILNDASMVSSEFYAKHLPILINVAQAIAFAHSKGIIHRDLKPSQVMIGEFGEVLVMDWGIAYSFEEKTDGIHGFSQGDFRKLLNSASNPAGTPCYMAPEQTLLTLKKLGPWTDIFLLGGILYFLLTKSNPYNDNDTKEVFRKAAEANIQPPEIRSPNTDIPKELSDLAMQAMAKDPKDRIPSVKVFIEILKDYLSGAIKRRESVAIINEIEKRTKEKINSYALYKELLISISKAEGLWDKNPLIKPLREKLIEQYALFALSKNDLMVARMETERLANNETKEALLQKINVAQQINDTKEKQRKILLAIAGVFLLLIILGGFKYAQDQKTARLKAENARKEALNQSNLAKESQRKAEIEQYFSAIGFGDAYIKEGRNDKVLELLLKSTPPWLHNWEWGYLLAQTYPDDMILQKTGPKSFLFDANFSPDETKIVTGDISGNITLWNAVTGRKLFSEKVHEKAIWSTVFSPDGKIILTTSLDMTAKLIDAESGKTIFHLKEHTRFLRSGAFSHDGKIVATTSRDKTICLWDTEKGTLINKFTFPTSTYDLAFSADDSKMVVALLESKAYLVDVKSGKILKEYKGATQNVLGIDIDPQGKFVATGGSDSFLRVYDINTAQLIYAVENSSGTIHNLRFSNDGSFIATGDEKSGCTLWDTKNGKIIKRLFSGPRTYKVRFASDGSRILTTAEKEIRIWNLKNIIGEGTIIKKSDIPQNAFIDKIRVIGFPFDIKDIWRTMDTFWLAEGGRHYIKTNNNYYSIDSYYLIASPDGSQHIVIDYNSFAAKVCKENINQPFATICERSIYNACFSPSGKLAATGSMSGIIQIWDTSTWTEILSYTANTNNKAIWSLAFIKDESLLLFGDVDGNITLLDYKNQKVIYKISAHLKGISNLVLTPNKKFFVSAASDNMVKVWDVEDGKSVSVLSGHTGFLYSASLSPDGKRIVTAAADGTVKLWETATGREIITLYSDPSILSIMGAYFSEDGKRILIVKPDGGVIEKNSFPYNMEMYNVSSLESFEKQVELWKRQQRINKSISLDDINWDPDSTIK